MGTAVSFRADEVDFERSGLFDVSSGHRDKRRDIKREKVYPADHGRTLGTDAENPKCRDSAHAHRNRNGDPGQSTHRLWHSATPIAVITRALRHAELCNDRILVPPDVVHFEQLGLGLSSANPWVA